jgi:hypothetical protein
MPRKDYIAMAAAFREARGDSGELDRGADDLWYAMLSAVADVMARDNPRFNRAKFLLAAGVKS